MKNKSKKGRISRELVQYGIVMGLLVLILQILNYHTLAHDLRLSVAGGFIAVLFLIYGWWLGKRNLKKKQSQPVHIPNGPESLNLSQREMEVVQLIAAGYSNKEIADELFVSTNTIKTHLSNIFSKMNAKRRTQVIQVARDHNLI